MAMGWHTRVHFIVALSFDYVCTLTCMEQFIQICHRRCIDCHLKNRQ